MTPPQTPPRALWAVVLKAALLALPTLAAAVVGQGPAARAALGGGDAASLGRALGALAPRLGAEGGRGLVPTSPSATLLAQSEGTTHRPVSYASSPSLPGTLNAPWWTDFAHLVYWFYVVATFTTVAFLGYLYDLLVRRREAAHPVRETRGFSRAQTGDLVTAVLPLTWSATMVMHASTHSINFDENTAGAAFSFTVIAYQWGWNYYFPRDVVAQLEAAPRVVGRGRVVAFAPAPAEAAAAAALDLWAVRATLGGRHGSRTGRLNGGAAALALALPTDAPAGAGASLRNASPEGWRAAAALALGDAAPSPEAPAPAGKRACLAPMWGVETPTTFLARPSAFVAGDRVLLGAPHYRPGRAAAAALAAAWAAQPHGRGTLVAPAPSGLPALANLGGSLAVGRGLAPLATTGAGLHLLRGAAPMAPTQRLLWTGPDALTGAGFTALGSTEDMGWLTPVPAREATSRASLAAREAWARGLPAEGPRAPGPLVLPFDLLGRALLAHPGGGVPSSWVGASGALEAEVSGDSTALWAGGLIPELGPAALKGPAHLGPLARPCTGLRLAPAPASLAISLAGLGESGRGGAAPAALAALGVALGRPQGRAPTLRPTLAPAARRGVSLAWGARASGPSPLPAAPGQGWALVAGGPSAPSALARAQVAPSLPGLGLDEARLVRSASARLADPALVAGKVDATVGPFTSFPQGPISLLGLGWSSAASLSSYPSFKMARGALLRRPMGGLGSAVGPHVGLPDPLGAPLLAKAGAPEGASRLRLWAPAGGEPASLGSALDVGRARWAAVWAFAGPAPAEDLDPSFINTVWTPETNTTRRSDHNSRYLVTWAPLAAPLTRLGAADAGQSGPAARAGLAPAAVRASLLALNEAGLKNTRGGSGALAALATPTAPRPGLGGAPSGGAWPALWAFSQAFGPSPCAFVGQPTGAAWGAGRAGALLTSKARAGAHGALSPELSEVSSGHSLVSLIATLDLARMTGPDHGPLPRQGFVPLSSSISASRRLRVTKGIALPSDTPMHIICGSKDVIHSWAIPGLGVKIDCIPGYNSHRRLLLRWRGAYWGQCMEVCGRYHHWMPIMVNVVHPALFADWCLAFLRGLDTQAQGGAVGPTPQALGRLLEGLA